MIKTIIITVLVTLGVVAVGLFLVFYPAQEVYEPNDEVVTNFDECVAAGNPIMENYPRRCRHGEVTFVEDISDRVFTCTREQKDAEACIEIYQPVCATINVQCITTPCPPVLETFSNSCKACHNSLVDTYAMGECTVEE
jgi:hypothetical protein